MSYMDAIYADIPGAFYSARSGAYIVPCDAVVEVTLIFGWVTFNSDDQRRLINDLIPLSGVRFPVHPIDTVQASLGTNGDIICYSGFLPNDFDLDGT